MVIPLSIAQISPGSPIWVTLAVEGALALHIGGGVLAIVSGFASVAVRKGEALHRAFGSIFFLAMLMMAAMGTALAVWIGQPGNIAGGILAFYLVSTAWMAVIREDRRIGAFEYVAMILVAAVGLAFFAGGALASMSPNGMFGKYPAPIYYGPGVFALFLSGLDLRVIRLGGVAGVQRIARHLWRMCASLFVASASFFLGQQKVMPAELHGSPVLALIALAPLAVMAYWLWRIRRPSRSSRTLAATPA